MFKSLFSKYFSVISLIILSSFLIMTVLQLLLFTRSVAEDKKELLLENVSSIATHTEYAATESTISGSGAVVYQLDQGALSPMLGVIADAIDATVLVTDGSGKVLLCSDGIHSTYIGNTAPAALVTDIGESYFEVSTLNGLFSTRRYNAASPILINGRVLGYVFVSAPVTSVMQTLRSNFQVYLMSALGALVLSCAAVYMLTYRFVRPLREMAAATRRFAQGDFSARIPVHGQDEVAELALALNHMAVSLSSVEMMRRSFVANVSHELKTPMTTIAGFVDGILDGTIPPEKQRHYMKIVSDEVKRLSRLVRSMLDLSRIDSGELKMTTVRMDLTEVVCSVLVASEQRIEKKGLHITGMEDCGKMLMDGDYDLMNQVLYNLLDNAIKFTNEGGDIDIRLSRDAGRINCVIRNTGDGIPAQEMPQIFERFYKSDRSRSLDKNGMGLGLYIVKTVIGLHHGEISVRSVEGEFTEFAFWVPAAEPEPVKPARDADGQDEVLPGTVQ